MQTKAGYDGLKYAKIHELKRMQELHALKIISHSVGWTADQTTQTLHCNKTLFSNMNTAKREMGPLMGAASLRTCPRSLAVLLTRMKDTPVINMRFKGRHLIVRP